MSVDEGRNPQREWTRRILQYISEHPDRPLKTRALGRALAIDDADYAEFRKLIQGMVQAGSLALGPARTLRIPATPASEVRGVFHAHRAGFGFVTIAGRREDVYVPRGRTGRALDGDTVVVRMLAPNRRTGQARAGVIRVVERSPMNWVGVLERSGRHWMVRPQGREVRPTVTIDDPTAKGAREGELVVIEPLTHDGDVQSIRGVIVERLGDPGRADVVILGVMRRYSISGQFGADVRDAARAAAGRFDPNVGDDREDLRDLLTITIDPRDARDFDDAISLRKLDRGGWELGVHIADVAHFVPVDGPIDREARSRGTSVYFPGRVAPMLPELLSNEVCSLQPGQPRFTKTVFIAYDAKAAPRSARVVNGVIQSKRRLTYETAAAIIDNEPADEPQEVVDLVRDAAQLARQVQARRKRAGAIALEIPDVELALNDDGEVTDAQPEHTHFSHTLIEMFMVEANEAICRLLHELDVPHLRRLHPPPGDASAGQFQRIAAALGSPIKGDFSRKAIGRLLDEVDGTPAARAVSLALLRCLSQAYYGPEREGHFALASEHYCHFTSPIRRYPDLLIHRLLDAHLRGGLHSREVRRSLPGEGDLAELGRACSDAERRAQRAENEATQALLIEYLRGRVGEVFDGVVVGVASAGAFVQIWPVLAEGMVRVEDFPADQWQYDDAAEWMVGRITGRTIKLGDAVQVRLAAIDDSRQSLVLTPERLEDFGSKDAAETKRVERARNRRQRRRTSRRVLKRRK